MSVAEALALTADPRNGQELAEVLEVAIQAERAGCAEAAWAECRRMCDWNCDRLDRCLVVKAIRARADRSPA